MKLTTTEKTVLSSCLFELLSSEGTIPKIEYIQAYKYRNDDDEAYERYLDAYGKPSLKWYAAEWCEFLFDYNAKKYIPALYSALKKLEDAKIIQFNAKNCSIKFDTSKIKFEEHDFDDDIIDVDGTKLRRN